jgi:hypothetical protein
MKTALLITAALLTAATANASKSRLAALGGSHHLNDVQDVFTEPSKAMMFNETVFFEYGSADTWNATTGANAYTTTTAATPHGEGGIIRKMDDSAWGIYLGRQNANFNTMIGAADEAVNAGTNEFMREENPFNIFYAMGMGDMKVGFGLNYSKGEKKGTGTATATHGPKKSNSMGVSASASTDVWTAKLSLGLAGDSSIQATGGEIKAQMESSYGVEATYAMDTMTFLFGMNNTGVKLTNAGTENLKVGYNDMTLAVVNSINKDGANVFYGAKYMMSTTKSTASGTETKTETTVLPLWVGVEAEGASWLVIRGSVAQNFFMGSKKTTTGGTGEANSIDDNTSVAGGLGFKWGKFMLDGTLNAATNGNLNLGGGTNG